MNNFFTKTDVASLLARLDMLNPNSEKQWGKMTVDQMLAHCVAAMRVANAETFPQRIFLGRIFGPFFKHKYIGEGILDKNTPTDKTFVITNRRDFETEKKLLKEQIQKFANGGEAGVTKHPHSFFGNLTPMQWSIGMWKHIDHHLRQFGV